MMEDKQHIQNMADNESQTTKRFCNKCKSEKELNSENFYRNRSRTCGFEFYCKECEKTRRRERTKRFIEKRKYNSTGEALLKTCTKCGETKEASSKHFHRDNGSKDGFRGQCKNCKNKNKKRSESRRWTDEEKDILRKHYPFFNNKEIHENLLPNRTPAQIGDHAIKVLKLKKDKSYVMGWSQEQLSYLKDNYEDLDSSIEDISKVIGKEEFTIVARANEMGMFRPPVKLFTERDHEILREYYHNTPNKELIKRFFPDRTSQQITAIANKLGLRITPELKREHAIKNLVDINNTKEPTKPELLVEELLKDMFVDYDFQHHDKYYWVDFYLPNENLIVEVQGDYFHCHPHKKFNYKVLNKSNILTKDKRKNSYFRNQRGIEVLYVWEEGLNNNNELCRKLIEKYIDNKGVLENYHSFNYENISNELKIRHKVTEFSY